MSLIKNGKKIAGLYKADLIKNATDTQAGIIRIATDEEVQGGTSSTTAITPYQLANQAPKTLVDNTTITKDDTDTITTIGVKSKNNVILYDWIGTEEEYNTAYGNGDIEPDWICWIIDDETTIEPVSNKTTSDVALLDMIISNHILEGDEKVGKEFQGSLILKSVYPDAYNKLLNSYSTASDVTEIISNIEVTYKKCTNTWKILDITNKSVYDQLFETTGSANFFVIDTYNESFYLPKTVNFFQPVTDVNKANGFTEAGLPNIEGTITRSSTDSGIIDMKYNINTDGAFKVLETGKNSHGATSSGSTNTTVKLGFDASASNSIYGNSDTVQPASNNIFVYYKVGTTISSEGLINISTAENDTIPLFTGMYFDFTPNNFSWLKAGQQHNNVGIYTFTYSELVNVLNGETKYGDLKVINEADMVSGVDYSLYWKVNQTNMTFTTPTAISNKALSGVVKGNGMTLGLTNGIDNVGLTSAFSSSVNMVQARQGAYGLEISKGISSSLSTIDFSNLGVTTDPDKSGIIAEQSTAQLYFKVANAVQNLELLNAGEVLEALADKISHQDCPAYIVETYQNEKSGYNIYSNGFCSQWGYVDNTTAIKTISLLKPYKDTNYIVFATSSYSTSDATLYQPHVDSLTTTSFKCASYGERGNATNSNGASVFWKTEGYIN